ncbi:hypothetical protein BDF22DRAFT_656665 [Syncephalis plumigaleata]|nr:hypothetical protein BDF22DRAFT_656665 [Syncephalis plumigaleata]
MASLNTPYINFTGQLLNFHMINSIQVVVYLTDYTEQLAIGKYTRVDTIRQRKQNYLKLSDNQWPSAMQDDSFVDTKRIQLGHHLHCLHTPAIFRVKARVVSYFPHQVEHFCKLICTNCNRVNRYVYRFALLLSDSMDEPVTTTNRLLRISVIDNEACHYSFVIFYLDNIPKHGTN